MPRETAPAAEAVPESNADAVRSVLSLSAPPVASAPPAVAAPASRVDSYACFAYDTEAPTIAPPVPGAPAIIRPPKRVTARDFSAAVPVARLIVPAALTLLSTPAFATFTDSRACLIESWNDTAARLNASSLARLIASGPAGMRWMVVIGTWNAPLR